MPALIQPTRLGRKVVTSTVGERVEAFVPPPLPPDPPIRLEQMSHQLAEASQALGRLDGMTSVLPPTSLLLYMYVRREALLSSQIEGTQSSLSELLLFESDGTVRNAPLDDVQEVSSYVAAMNFGMERIRDGYPVSLRLIRELHEILLKKGRGSSMQPGEFRHSQNWIGGTRPGNARYVPPPHEQVLDLMSVLEAFINASPSASAPDMPTLIKAGLAHVQFETIHPFLDGNGRLGRLLITLLLCSQGILKEPTLYLSLYFKTHRQQYYDLLQQVREQGDWEAWLAFFLEGITETSNQAVETTQELMSLFENDRQRIESLGRASASVLRVHQLMQQVPIIAIGDAASKIGVTAPTVAKAIQHLEALGMVREISGRRRNRLYIYTDYMNIMERGTEPL